MYVRMYVRVCIKRFFTPIGSLSLSAPLFSLVYRVGLLYSRLCAWPRVLVTTLFVFCCVALRSAVFTPFEGIEWNGKSLRRGLLRSLANLRPHSVVRAEVVLFLLCVEANVVILILSFYHVVCLTVLGDCLFVLLAANAIALWRAGSRVNDE